MLSRLRSRMMHACSYLNAESGPEPIIEDDEALLDAQLKAQASALLAMPTRDRERSMIPTLSVTRKDRRQMSMWSKESQF